MLSRALIRLRKGGLEQHDENCGTKSSNPLPSSGESVANCSFEPMPRELSTSLLQRSESALDDDAAGVWDAQKVPIDRQIVVLVMMGLDRIARP